MNRFFILLFVLFYQYALPAQSITWITACSDQTFCLAQGNCSVGHVLLTEKAVTVCSLQSVDYSYKIDLDNNGGIDINSSEDTVNQNFTKGTHKIYWKASDNCGNVAYCTYLFTVKDCQPPNLLCINGLTQGLDLPSCEVSFMASQFILNVSDNCTPVNQLQYGVRKFGTGTGFPATSSVTFNKCEVGTNLIEIWVKDANGLSNSCNNYVIVQNNAGSCVCNPDGDVGLQSCVRRGNNSTLPGGYTLKSTLESLGGVVTPINKIRQITTTDSCASLGYDKLPFGGNYRTKLSAQKSGLPLEGVSTYDLVLISKHILGVQAFQSIYQSLAADVNKNNAVTTTDIVEIRKLLLGISDTFQYVPVWRMVCPVANPSNLSNLSAVKDTYQITLNNLVDDTTLLNLNFIGCKSGDVNYSAASLLGNADDRDDQPALRLIYEDSELAAGQEIAVPIRWQEGVLLNGWQMALHVDPNLAQIMSIEGIPSENISQGPDGQLRLLWYDGEVRQFAVNEPVFTLKIKALQAIKISDLLRLSPDGLKAEAYVATPSGSDEPRALILQSTASMAAGVQFFPPRPNPFDAETVFGLDLAAPSSVVLEVFDLEGRLITRASNDLEAGLQSMRLPAELLPGNGVFVFRLSANGGVFGGRVVRF